MEELLSKYIVQNEPMMNNQDKVIQKLKIQMGQLMNVINNRPQGSLPIDTKINPRN